MNYTSTRGTVAVNETYALLHGLAEDGGLYVPSLFPTNCLTYNDVKDKNYQEVAAVVLAKLFPCFSEAHLNEMINSAYSDANFSTRDIAPMHSLLEKVSVLELFHGRTQAFKDMALSLFPYLLVAAKEAEGENKEVLILTATSGDTGKAALEGFKDVPGTHIQVFYPTDGVSPMQAEQMQKQEGENVNVTAIHGNFDDAQQFLKRLFVDKATAEEVAAKGVMFSSANSINIGRLIPQVAYYVYGYAKLVERGVISDGDKINIVVPTGNFGNILAAYYAGKMGIPVNRFICASNENNVLTDFFNTGVYDINREFYLTNSPSMDILISSNLERLLYHLAGNDGAEIRSLMEALDTKKKYEVSETIRNGMKDFYGGCANVEETNEAVGRMYRENGYLMDTHTAVAYKVYEDYVKETGDRTPALIASTASAYKFADSVAHSIGLGDEENGFEYVRALAEKTGVRVPAGLKDLDKKEIRHRGVIKVSEMPEAVENSVK